LRLELSVSTALLSLRDAIQLLVGTHLPTADFRKCGRKVTELEVALRQIDCRRIAPTVPKLGVPRAHVERQCWSAIPHLLQQALQPLCRHHTMVVRVKSVKERAPAHHQLLVPIKQPQQLLLLHVFELPLSPPARRN
jgi:hypothetical protein